MAEYIEREALLKEIQMQKDASRTSFPKQHFVVGDVLTCIYLSPAADVAPVRYGEWIAYRGGKDRQCSECNWSTDFNIPRNFCPNCGAIMDLEG